MSYSVLIADDHPAVRMLLIRLVRRANPHARIVDVASGQAALDLCQATTPHLVVLDHGLPDMSGFSVLQQIKTEPDPPYVIVVTGNPALENDARAQGADEVWIKPMDVTRLLPHLAQLLHDA